MGAESRLAREKASQQPWSVSSRGTGFPVSKASNAFVLASARLFGQFRKAYSPKSRCSFLHNPGSAGLQKAA
jgi:hypothetical protein